MPRKGQQLTPEARAKVSAARRAFLADPAQRAIISEHQRRLWRNPEYRARALPLLTATSRNRGMRHTTETKVRLAEAARGNQNVANAAITGECVYCFGVATTYDHVVPRKRGGEEVVPCCFTCNCSKGNLTPDEWLARGLYGNKVGRRVKA